jgi:heparan-sulfate lyase
LWQPGDSLDILIVENKSYENLTHRRAVIFVDKRYFIIVDEAIGSTTGDVDIHFQMAPGGGSAIFNRENLTVQTGFNQGWNVFVQTQNQPGLKLEEEEGWVSFRYTEKEPRPAFRYSLKKESENSNVRFVSLVVPFEKEVPDIQITAIAEKSGKTEIEVLENGKRKIIDYKIN